MTFSDAYIELISGEPGDVCRDVLPDGIVDAANHLAGVIVSFLVPSDETSYALNAVEQAVMWADKSIRKHGGM